jgi:hypothetical protein
MRTQDGEDVVGAPHRATQDDRRVGDAENVVERFVVFYVTHVDAEEGRRDVDLLAVEDDDGRKWPSSRDESGRKRARNETDLGYYLCGSATQNLESVKKTIWKFI